MNKYFVNNNPTHNPGFHHEVHTDDCAIGKLVTSKTDLGWKPDGVAAVAAAKHYYSDADGAKCCCPEAHKG